MNPFDVITVPTFHEIVERHARERPDAPALRFHERAWTYAAMDRWANRVANTLLREGLAPGDRILFVGRNSDAVALLALAGSKAGITLVPLNWRLAPAEMQALAEDSGAKLVFAEPDYLEVAAQLGGSLPLLSTEAVTVGSDWLATEASSPAIPPDPHAVLVQVYTSGTTGVPKGVMLMHRSLLGINALRHLVPWDSWGPDDVTLVSAPLGHVGAFGMMARALFFGGEAVIQETFDSGTTLDAIERHGITKLALVPTAIRMILDHPRARDVDYGRLDTILYGSAPIAVELLREAVAVFGCKFAQSYGASETSGPAVALPPDDHDPNGNPRMASAGVPLPGTEIKVIGPDGEPLPTGEIGEICIRSIATMKGYWNRPEETARALGPDGWLRTGDAGLIDADGYLHIRARIKEMIVSGAENVYPAEVENVLASHPSVAQVAVIGVPDPHWGEAVKAIVVPKPGAAFDAASVIAWARQRIAGYKLPKSIDIVDALPLNATGKIDKLALRAPYWEGRDRDVS
jgi:acyl-CoA synthetase (AMP-forming)/AMP-acid ligase II